MCSQRGKQSHEAILNEQLRQARNVKGWTQQEVAEKIGVLPNNYSRWERGEAFPSSYSRKKLSKLFGKSEQELGLVRKPTSIQPPLAPPHATPLNKTLQGIPLIGREQAIKEIYAKLQEGTRFLTLTGVPGVGKTELARQVAKLAQTQVYFSHVLPILYLDIVPPPADFPVISPVRAVNNSADLMKMMRKHLYGVDLQQRVLLVLDNVEQITDIDNARGRLSQFLDENSTLTILATSRLRFSVSEYEVCSLKTPVTEEKNNETIERLRENDAVRLFIEGARRTSRERNTPPFDVTDQNASIIAALCRGLGGLPLALLIAGSWATKIDMKDLYAMLQTKNIHDLPDYSPDSQRHRTLDTLIDVSYHLLTDQQKTLFRRLGVLAGRCTWKAAAAICGFEPLPTREYELLPILDELSRHFLITFENEYIDLAHITLHDYAIRQRDQSTSQEWLTTTWRFASYYMKVHKDWNETIERGDIDTAFMYLEELANIDWAEKTGNAIRRLYIKRKKLQLSKEEYEILRSIMDIGAWGGVDKDFLYGFIEGIYKYRFRKLTEEEREQRNENLLNRCLDLIDEIDVGIEQWMQGVVL